MVPKFVVWCATLVLCKRLADVNKHKIWHRSSTKKEKHTDTNEYFIYSCAFCFCWAPCNIFLCLFAYGPQLGSIHHYFLRSWQVWHGDSKTNKVYFFSISLFALKRIFVEASIYIKTAVLVPMADTPDFGIVF